MCEGCGRSNTGYGTWGYGIVMVIVVYINETDSLVSGGEDE